MLPNGYRDRVNQLVNPRFDDCRDQLKSALELLGNQMAAQGNFRSGAHLKSRHEKCVEQVRIRTGIVWDSLKRVASALAIPYSDSLAAELKNELEYYVPIGLWELQGTYVNLGLGNQPRLLQEFHSDLAEKRIRELKRIGGEIDLYIDGLKAKKSDSPELLSKEYDQKFGILLSPAQAGKDFEKWQRDLEPNRRPIGVLFVDIDNFKRLNERYTETKVDQTLLPEVLNLLADLVRFRGEGYRQGGDEFVLILPNYDTSECYAFGEKLRASFEGHTFDVDGSTERLTISVGIALWPDHGGDYPEVLQRANDGKRIAKVQRNTVKLAPPTHS